MSGAKTDSNFSAAVLWKRNKSDIITLVEQIKFPYGVCSGRPISGPNPSN